MENELNTKSLVPPMLEDSDSYIDYYLDLIASGNVSFLVPIIIAGLFTWLIWKSSEDSDK